MARSASLLDSVRGAANLLAGAIISITILVASEAVKISIDWTAVGAIATCAAVATALYIAIRESERHEANRIASARVVAAAIGQHLEDALWRCEMALQLLEDYSEKSTFGEIARIAPLLLIKRTKIMQRFLDRFESFGSQDGYIVMAAVAALTEVKRQVRGLKEIAELDDLVTKLPIGSTPKLLSGTRAKFVNARDETNRALTVLRVYELPLRPQGDAAEKAATAAAR